MIYEYEKSNVDLALTIEQLILDSDMDNMIVEWSELKPDNKLLIKFTNELSGSDKTKLDTLMGK